MENVATDDEQKYQRDSVLVSEAETLGFEGVGSRTKQRIKEPSSKPNREI